MKFFNSISDRGCKVVLGGCERLVGVPPPTCNLQNNIEASTSTSLIFLIDL